MSQPLDSNVSTV